VYDDDDSVCHSKYADYVTVPWS